mmetsp:Transcript_21272/g.41648  ORF Transcript_21272/g.41648 Transcript_21272/m.41648 type:complete len:311 (-) Transcript_21272:230-1162(-)|eukprot:CAMPEP_0172708618 /NCGR_PEP_ID=MMETSP1074-20121228/51620_1 /TAXON_ID=2916 /ORGANISM="Ceratium fusus, Strain PA161109" /LENGTH=310 /DNA_ID=CAMNT_0013531635 /DNA_START=55 /DNA_END=987 /DNA_ORIENTATION=-
MAARWLTAGFTLGASELVRAVDPDTANAMCDNNPLGAVANAVEHRSLGPLSNALRADRVVTRATRNVPVVNAVTSAVTSAANYGVESPLNVAGFGITNRGPQETPDGYAYACALVAAEVYNEDDERKETLKDKDGWVWKRLPGWQCNKLAVYTHARSDTCIIGLRGTDPFDQEDVFQDVDLAFWEGLIHIVHSNGRTRLSCEKVRELVDQYDNVYLTGHSLGGFLAFQLALPHPKVQVHIFNAGANGLNLYHHAAYAFMNISDRATHHHVRGDPFSAGFSEAYVARKDYNCPFDSYHAHLMVNFILPEHQ